MLPSCLSVGWVLLSRLFICSQLTLYGQKFDEFQATLAKSNEIYTRFKKEMDNVGGATDTVYMVINQTMLTAYFRENNPPNRNMWREHGNNDLMKNETELLL